ncbi:MAG TPA: prolyl oligopeptidase family serine peptidase [Blastocatellia bacterium]|nr:prolyl oligopeptidase family serine peptidase [Blastocatellia bacterium]
MPCQPKHLHRAILWTAILSAALIGAVDPWPGFSADGSPDRTVTMEQVLSYPFPQGLVAAPRGERIAWVLNERGVRNIWVAEGPEFKARQVTEYKDDDGQELTSLSFSHDGGYVVYVRGGDHDSNWQVPNEPDPASSPVQPKVQIWAVSFEGGMPKLLADGDLPQVSPRNGQVAFVKEHQIWSVPLDGSKPAARMFFARGENKSPCWSPDGGSLAFVSEREGDHAFIGVYTSGDAPIKYLAPSTSWDSDPQWSPDGTEIAFVRLRGRGGAPLSVLDQHPNPWKIVVADAKAGKGHIVWESPDTLVGSLPQTEGQDNLHWAAGNRLVFLADLDGWPHLYSIAESGGPALLLTPGAFMDEYVTLSPDLKYVVYNANTGTDKDDDDRRHLFRVPVDSASPIELTSGPALEWAPVVTGDSKVVGFISAGPRQPPLTAVIPAAGGSQRLLASDQIPSSFPEAELVVPRKVMVKAEDGIEVHCQLFEKPGGAAKKPGVIFVHGGPPRQMLLGWHYMDYYSNGYAVNQYLANHGYVVVSVNYRLGIGYGHAFHHPDHAGYRGAAEYKDVLAAAHFLQGYDGVDPKRIGIWGGSYGGYLTALALARNSDVFAAGVDLHGVHDWSGYLREAVANNDARYEKNDAAEALKVAWESSPVAWVSSWRSPVLLIQGDDDRNVHFHQMVDLVRRLQAAGVKYEEIVIPDEIHGFLRHRSWLEADSDAVDYFGRQFGIR